MPQQSPTSLGIVKGGISDGIEIVDHRKHWALDDEKHPSDELQRLTDPWGNGSKWLKGLPDAVKFEIIKGVLETNLARLQPWGVRGRYRSVRQPDVVGIVAGRHVRSVEVIYDGRRYAHGYPCDP